LVLCGDGLNRITNFLGFLGAIAAILTVGVSFFSLTKSTEHFGKQLKSSADQFSTQLEAQKRATSVATLSEFMSTIGASLVRGPPIKDRAKFERLVVTRSELLMRSFGHPPLTNQVIYFLGTDDLGHLFSSTRLFEMKPFVSLSNVNLQETKIQDIILPKSCK